MTPDLLYLVYTVVLTWVMIMFAATAKARLWTLPGFMYGAGNRDTPNDSSAMAQRADRAAKNMLENLLLFATLMLTARAAGVASTTLVLPAQIFFFARLAYWPIYVVGLPYVRTLAWAAGVAGMGMIVMALLA